MGSIYVNGRFLGRPVTGVERFASMILKEADILIGEGEFPAGWSWKVLAPSGISRPDNLNNIEFGNVGRLKGHAWEQLELPWSARSGILLNLCNAGPIAHPRELTVLHDAWVYRFPGDFSPTYGLLHRTLGRLLARRSKLATVSQFSRAELAEVLGLDPAGIGVIPNASDHVDALIPDSTILDRFGLVDRPFFLFVGSPAPNKNLARAIEAFRRIEQDANFVIVGAAAKSFADARLNEMPANVVTTGRLSDAEIAALYRSARALVFPSLYEGFGIPPLEAMRFDCPVLASDIPATREVCGDAALYFNPKDIPDIARVLDLALCRSPEFEALPAKAARQVSRYSWRASAEELLRNVRAVTGGSR